MIFASRWGAGVLGRDEFDCSVDGGFELVLAAVDDDVVVVPAEGDKVVGVVAAVVGARDDVVGLETVAG